MALSSQVTSKKNVTIFYLAIHLLNSLIRTKEPKYKKIGKKKKKKKALGKHKPDSSKNKSFTWGSSGDKLSLKLASYRVYD